MSRDWRLYLEDMIDCCQKIIDYTSGLDMPVFKTNSLVYDATLRNLEILGEAAKNIPEDIRGRYPQVEWRKVIGLRDVLTHFYFGWRMRRFGTSSITRSRNCCPFLRAFRMKIGESL